VDFNPNDLILEITESIFIEERETVKHFLEDLNALGIKIHLDDFGTGFSSLSYLSSLPINALKIDREFTSKIDPTLEHQGLLELIIALAQNIGIPTIAEGVEKSEQLPVLKKVGCDYVQGYYLQNALTLKAADTFLRKNKHLYS
jgi:EAL domain-containing protein (putative c-di-GMP-specific phosphodiesterase class I)